MYTALGHPEKAAKWLKVVMDSIYKVGPDGLSGNDDCGQMSAWYIFNALGFYPVAPGSDEYQIGSPIVKNATLKLDNGTTFKITVENQSEANKYIQRISLNGKILAGTVLKHSDIMNGGELNFIMTNKHPK